MQPITLNLVCTQKAAIGDRATVVLSDPATGTMLSYQTTAADADAKFTLNRAYTVTVAEVPNA